MAHPALRRCSTRSAISSHDARRRPWLESLEPRHLLTAVPGSTGDLGLLSGTAGVCGCPICSGQGLADLSAAASSPVNSIANAPLTSLPLLSSNPGATAKLFLDFDGRLEASWGGWSNVTTPVYDQDGDATSFSTGELTSIQNIWAAVAEDYAPFNIDVTTIDPGSVANKVVAVIAIGGSSSAWYGSPAGGVAYVGGFYNSAPNVGYVFENELGNGYAKYVAEAVSHEAGHLFGLSHQSVWSGTTISEEYNDGNANWAPIMGVGYYSTRTTWHNGTSDISFSTYQDDISILAGSQNGFGLKNDDFGNTTATAANLQLSSGNVNFAGLITRHDDVDVWKFTSSGGNVSFSMKSAAYGPNLAGILELRDENGNLVANSDLAGSFNATISKSLAGGNYFLIARTDGTYGNMGQYTLTGTVPQSAVPEISVSVGGTGVSSGGKVTFTAAPGSTADQTITVKNTGTNVLNLSLIDPSTLSAGFSLVSNLGNTQLAAGESTQFVVRFSPTLPGAYTSSLSLLSDDADEGTFLISLAGDSVASTWGNVAFYLNVGRTATGDSWYSAYATQTGIFSAEAYFSQAAGNIDLEIYDSNNHLLGRSATSSDAERVDVNVTAGDRLYIRVLGSNANVTYRCTNLVSASGDAINVSGTTSDDLFVFLPGSTTHRVAVNGVGYDFDAATYRNIVMQDAGGVDTLVVIGTAQDETVHIFESNATVTSAGYSFTSLNAEFLNIYAGEGNDTATLYDRSGNDTFIGSPTSGSMNGVGYNANVYGFDVVDATFNQGGFDQAFLYGSIGDDRFEASPLSAFLRGPGYRLNTSGYDTVVAVGGWGNDLALLADSAGDDVFIGEQDAGSLSGVNSYLRAANFDRVEARSSGGFDQAYLWDSAGDDYFGGSRVLAFFNGVGFSNYVEGFDHVSAISRSGNDTADLYDSAGDDRLILNGRTSRMEANDYSVQIENFKVFRAYASLGYDTVTMQQLLSTDTIRGRSNWVSLNNAAVGTAYGFDLVTAVAKPGQRPKTDLLALDYIFSKSGW